MSSVVDPSSLEELFRVLAASVRDYAVMPLDASGRIAGWNVGAERMTGFRAADIVGRPVSELYPEGEAEQCARQLATAARERRSEIDGWWVRHDGSRFRATVVITVVCDAAGAVTGFTLLLHNLGERERAESVRLEAEQRFRQIVESVRDYAIFMLDTHGRILTWNVGAERLKGYRAEEIIGRHFSVFYPKEEIESGKCERELEGAARDGRYEDEGWRLRKDGSRFWANVVISAVRDSHGHLVGFSKVTRDLTERKRAEDDRARRLAAEHANRAKDEFLAMLGHELRNPLAPISTALQLMRLRGGEPSKEQQVIERQVDHLMRLVDDLLDVSRIVRGKVQLKRRRLDLREIIAKAIEIASPVLEQKQHHLEVARMPGALAIDGDEARLVQVFSNLLVNAAKYTDTGGHISISARTLDHAMAVEVRDDGIGIEPALLPRVFDLFVQGYQGVERSRGGLGLGLTLVHTLVEMHGGTVTAYSAGPGEGSTFSVNLPLAAALDADERPAAVRAPAIAREPRRVLVVDDNADALELLAEALAAAGHDVRTALDPAAALEIARDFRPEIAIVDIGLPVMDGYELASRLRSELGDATLAVIALTGYGQESDRARSADAGFLAHFVKPVDVQRLSEAIARA
ncbi:MAG TPA: PAS domain S-box protein [Kofleriaceae bacterium]|nr:PAS domain S-box protein [Kofleriaceae bacterium]